MYNPKITVIVAVFNGAATLSRCLKSIYSQSYSNKELIVIDGGSTDDSVNIIQDSSSEIAYWESKPDRGIYHAWNKALSHATGEWICFLGSDDYFWQDDVLEKMIPSLHISQTNGIRLVYGRIASVDTLGKVKNLLGVPWDKKKSVFLHQMPPHPGLFHHSDLFEEHGNYDESYSIAADYEFLLRELIGGEALFVPEIIVAGFQYGGVSSSSRHLLKLISEDLSARSKHGLSPVTIPVLKYYTGLLVSTLKYELIHNTRMNS